MKQTRRAAPGKALFLIFGSLAWAQSGVIRGTITDPLGALVKDAQVSLKLDSKNAGDTVADANGVYTFSSVAAGYYHVAVFAQGFANYEGTDEYFDGKGTKTIDVLLQISALKQQVVVSATGSETPISQLGASVTLIDNEAITSQNKLDVLENLRQVPGAQIVQNGQRGGATSLFIRGGESSFNKVMIDGAPSNAIGGGFDYAQLSNAGVESIEVLKSPNSVLYGADGLAGVVNVTTKRGRSTIPELKYSVDGGNFGQLNQSVSLGGAYKKLDYFSIFSRFDTRGSYQNNYFHNATYAGNFGFQPDAKTDIRVTYRRNWTDAGNPNGLLLYGIADDSSSKNQNQYLTGTIQHQTTSRWHNTARFLFAQAAATYANPSPTGQPDPYGFGNYLGNNMTIKGANGFQVTGQGILDYAGNYPQFYPSFQGRRSAYAQSDYSFFKEWTGTFGFRYEHENGSGFTRDNYSYFLEGHGNIAHRLYVTAGVGLENNAVFGFAASPRVSLAYYLRQPYSTGFLGDTKLKFNYGRGIKETSTLQQGNQLWAFLTPAQREQYKVSELGPERSRALDAGFEQGLFHGRARLELTYFHNEFIDLISYLTPVQMIGIGVPPEAANATGFGAYVNASSNKGQGFEAQITTDLGHGLRVQGNYTYLDAVTTKAFGNPSFNPLFPNIPIGAYAPLVGDRPFHRAPHSGSLSLLYSRSRWVATFTGYMVSRRNDSTFLSDALFGNTLLLPNQNLAPSYQKFDASARYRATKWASLYVSAENIFSQHYQAAFGYPALPATFRGGMTFTIGGNEWK
jgi:iron complex outermembrane receptor protein/vitamin B12 transporter